MQPLQIESSENVLETANTLLSVWRPVAGFRPEKALPPVEAEALIGRLVGWRENHNLYSAIREFLVFATASFDTRETHGRSLELNQRLQWDRFWSQQATDARDGDVKFRGGDILARSAGAYEQLLAEDFRLRPDSLGYRAGPDGKDLGADIDLVGPGKAYERWKNTPAYRKWLKDTGQNRK
jgi:hypothetical protein